MVGRLFRIFMRYAARRIRLEKTDLPSPGLNGITISRVAREDGQLIVEGKADATRVGLCSDGCEKWVMPQHPDGTFRLGMPFQTGASQLLVDRPGDLQSIDLPSFTPLEVRLLYAPELLSFSAKMLRHAPSIWAWRVSGNNGAREKLKDVFGFGIGENAVELSGPLFGVPISGTSARTVSIILPVFNTFELLPEVLARVLNNTDLPAHLIVIEDFSTDDRVRPYLQAWHAENSNHPDIKIRLIENPENLGFIKSVNLGLQIAADDENPVILLNSDALVPQGWASRLTAPLSDPTVASVTPFSNDAEIFTIPAICRRHELRPGQADLIDIFARSVNPKLGDIYAPTGVGFCMAMAPKYLRQFPQLDTVFGRGYGEETDWCQQTRTVGGRHVLAANLFVEHRGGTSFGSVEKQRLLAKNCEIISTRYPQYDAEVQDFIRDDPICLPRLALGLASAAASTSGTVPIFIAHALGGGAEIYLERRIADMVAKGQSAVVLRVGLPFRWRLELHTPQGVCRGATGSREMIIDLLAPLERRHIVYSCGVGDHDPTELPGLIQELAGAAESSVEVLIHDFLPLSPSYTLLNDAGAYRGVPGPDDSDPAHQYARYDGTTVTLNNWRRIWGSMIETASEVVVFSKSSKDLVLQAYPNAKTVIRPHDQPLPSKAPVAASGQRPVIGVLGNIGYQKGAQILSDMSRRLNTSREADLVLIGNLDPDYSLTPPARIHGDYTVEDIPHLAERYGIDLWLIPSIWPETFSFTTREALATGLPVWVFDLGAQAEAVRASCGEDTILPLSSDEGVNIDDMLSRMLAKISPSLTE